MSIFSLWNTWYRTTNDWLDKATKKHEWTKQDQEWYDATEKFNPFIELYKDRYQRETYIDRWNLDYSDITQPWNLPGGSDFGTVVSKSLEYVSDNIKRLYR